MICSFLASPPAATAPDMPAAWGGPVLRVGFRDGKPHARAVLRSEPTSRSRAPAASSLEFCPYFFGVSPPRAGAYKTAKGVHAPCETCSAGDAWRGVRAKKLIAHFGQAASCALYALRKHSAAARDREKGFPQPTVTEILLTRHSWTARTRGSTQFDLPAAYHLDS